MLYKKTCMAMLLAGGQGSRLGVLTRETAKPAVPFGGKYRIIDFPLSNCTNSDIDTVGVLTQYQPLELNAYIATGQPWDLDRNHGGVFVLPPYTRSTRMEWYKGTANAIYQNIGFIEQFSPENVLVLSGDHIYKMDYAAMLRHHLEREADATIAVFEVPWREASRFGIMHAREDGMIDEFVEKPKEPRSNTASMGVYMFTWSVLKKYLIEDNADPDSSNDFGKNVIPAMLKNGVPMAAYPFHGYWKDVGTIESLWEANMDLLGNPPRLDLYDPAWRIYARNPVQPPHYIGAEAQVSDSLITEGSRVYGKVTRSVLFHSVVVEPGAEIVDSVLMPGAAVKSGAKVIRSIVGENVVVGEGGTVGGGLKITTIGNQTCLPPYSCVVQGAMVGPNDTEKFCKGGAAL